MNGKGDGGGHMGGRDPDDRDMAMLDTMLAEARATPPAMSSGLEARMLADAREVQAGLAGPRVPNATRSNWLTRFGDSMVDAFGGWASLGGLVAAGLAGVWIGVAPPAFSGDPVARYLEARQDVDLFDTANLSVSDFETEDAP